MIMEEKNKTKVQEEGEKTKRENPVKAEVKSEKSGSAERGRKMKPWIILLVVNVTMLMISVYFILSLPKKASDLNKLRSNEQKVKESKNIDVSGLEYKPAKDNVDKLTGFYPDEGGVIKFIEMVDGLKEKGQIKNFSLVGQDAVKDKTGAYGIPFIVELEGSWTDINLSLQEVQKLPYLIRAINVEVNVIDENTVNLKYGGFLYVSDKLAKTR